MVKPGLPHRLAVAPASHGSLIAHGGADIDVELPSLGNGRAYAVRSPALRTAVEWKLLWKLPLYFITGTSHGGAFREH
jgi:hypothetical protein